MITISNAQGTIRFEYDSADRMTKVTYPDGRFLAYGYDAGGRRIQMTDASGAVIHYAYDAVGRVSGLTDGGGGLLVRYSYDAAGRLAQRDYGNGTFTTFEYDTLGRIGEVVNHRASGAENSRFEYGYDAIGRVAVVSTPDGQWVYQYDLNNQVTNARFTSTNPAMPNQESAYGYDAAGNRVWMLDKGTLFDYSVNGMNQYTQAGALNLLYDAEGNTIVATDGSFDCRYAYDWHNRLVRVSNGQETWEYEYDALGHRSAVIHNGQRTEYLVDPTGMGVAVAEYDGSGRLLARHVYGAELVCRVDPTGTAVYFDFDALGSTVGLTDLSGEYVNRYAYEPFGRTLWSVETVPNAYRYAGNFGVACDGNGLLFMRARYYDPLLGRFLTEDPVGAAAGDLNLYRYVGNSPVQAADPSGQVPCKEGWVVCIREPEGSAHKGTPYLQWFPKGCNPNETDSCLVEHEMSHVTSCWERGPQQFNFEKCNAEELRGLKIQKACYENKVGMKFAFPELDDLIKLAADGSKGKGPGYGFCKRPPKKAPPPPRPSCQQRRAPQPSLRPMDAAGELDGEGDLPSGESDWCYGGSGGAAGATDPNQKIGPEGVGEAHHVLQGAWLPYRIDFENQSTATAPAQHVVITDQLAPTLDWESLELTGIGFGDHFLELSDRTDHYEGVVPMTYNGQNLEVHIRVRLDLTAGRLTARFMSINPFTSLPPDVMTGFLPPEDGTGRGQGQVSYLVRAKANLPSGAEIRNVADIQFDFGETIATNQRDPHDPAQGTDPALEALVTIDSGPPSSRVLPLPAQTASATFAVAWSGEDDAGGSGVAGYDVYVSDQGAEWSLWQSNVTNTSALFAGQLGHTYAFFSVARDPLGHEETPPATADATTTVVASLPPELGVQQVGAAVVISWPESAGGSVLEATDLLGATGVWTPVADEPVLTAGRYTVTVQPEGVSRFYRLNQTPP